MNKQEKSIKTLLQREPSSNHPIKNSVFVTLLIITQLYKLLFQSSRGPVLLCV